MINDNIMFIRSAYRSFSVCQFQRSSALYLGGFWLAVRIFIIHQLKKKCSKSDYNDIVSLLLLLQLWFGLLYSLPLLLSLSSFRWMPNKATVQLYSFICIMYFSLMSQYKLLPSLDRLNSIDGLNSYSALLTKPA